MNVPTIRLAEVTTKIGSGITPRGGATVYKATGRPFLRSQNVGWGDLRLDDMAYIDEATHATFPATEIRAGDILLNITGASIGRSAVATPELDGGNVNQHVCEIRLKPGRMDPQFVNAFLLSRSGQDQIDTFQAGGNRQGLNFQQVGSIRVPDLPIEQQRAIGAASQNADGLISALEHLIAKKQAIKLGMMQQLLTGRTRLPGFSAPWVLRTLGDLARIKTGSRNNQDKKAGGAFPFFVRSSKIESIDTYSYDCEAILVPGEGGIGSIFHYINGKFEVHQRVYAISDFSNDASGRFIYYYMRQRFGAHAMENSVKATVDSLRLPTFRNFSVQLPSKNEQRAIVSVLDDATYELSTLQERLEKARAIKSGMMQQLLSGRTRLPAEVES